ncbi:hypothetical protein ABH940_006005 [Streptacidiphilus sp. BW17]
MLTPARAPDGRPHRAATTGCPQPSNTERVLSRVHLSPGAGVLIADHAERRPRASATSTPKPLLYLDIDGVLNPVCPHPDSGYRRHLLLRSEVEVLLSPAHAVWLRELAEVYDLAWASTWEAWANHCIAPLLGLPELPWVACGSSAGSPDGDFAPIVRHAAGRPFAWVDDLIPPRLLRRYAHRSDVLLLPVEPGQGLRRGHVDRLLSRPPTAV